jgi:hypothetical protein
MKLFQRTDRTHEASTLDDEIDTIERVMARYPLRRPPTFGAPTRCPECGEWGMVDQVRGLTSWNHCYFCPATWVITVRALRAIDAVPTGGSTAPILVAGDRSGPTARTDDGAAAPPPRLLSPRSARPRVQIVGC